MQTILLGVCAYLLGSIPTGKIVGLTQHIDIQKKGSGNIGFANAVRVLGWKLGVLVLVGDVLKGLLPTLLAVHYLEPLSRQLFVVSFLPIIGHAFPIWLKFKGGKSIATGLGVLIVLAPIAAVFVVAVYGLAIAIFKKSAIGSLTAAWFLPLFALFAYPDYTVYFLVFALFATYTHRNNIKQIIKEYAH